MIEKYASWTLLVAILAFNGVRACTDTRYLVAPPLILCGLISGVLIKSYLVFDTPTLDRFLAHDYYIFSMIYAIICLLFYNVAFHVGLRRRAQVERQMYVDRMRASVVAAYVTALTIIGFGAQAIISQQAGGLLAFYSKPHGSAVDYREISGYLHALPNFLWPALMIALFIDKPKAIYIRLYFLIITWILVAALAFHTFSFGNRNGVIRLTLVVGAIYLFRRRPTLPQAAPYLLLSAFMAVVVFVLPDLRDSLHLGAERTLLEGLADYWQKHVVSGHGKEITGDAAGHELFFNVGVLEAAWRTNTYSFGADFVYPILNFIPRAWWPEKPYEVDFGVNYFELVYHTLGWSPGEGAAINAVGWTFLSFSWAGCLVWVLMGYVSGRVWRRAMEAPTVEHLGPLMAAVLATVYWGTQSFSAVFAAWFFTITPFWGLRLLRSVSVRATDRRPFRRFYRRSSDRLAMRKETPNGGLCRYSLASRTVP
jgi:hypothetical protein